VEMVDGAFDVPTRCAPAGACGIFATASACGIRGAGACFSFGDWIRCWNPFTSCALPTVLLPITLRLFDVWPVEEDAPTVENGVPTAITTTATKLRPIRPRDVFIIRVIDFLSL